MSILDEISKTIADAGQTTLQRGKEMMDSAKCRSLIADEERLIQNSYENIGKKYFEHYSDSPEDLFSQDISAIKDSQKRIEELKKDLETIKGIMQCPNCGAELPIDVAFCSSCGKAINNNPQVPNGAQKCSGCGAAVPAGSNFCTKCGKPIN